MAPGMLAAVAVSSIRLVWSPKKTKNKDAGAGDTAGITGVVKSSLSADVATSISTAATSDVIDLLGREEATLKSLFGVSGVTLCDRNLGTTPAWQYKDTLDVDGTFSLRIYTKRGTDVLCRYRDRTYSPPGGARKVPPLLDIHAARRR